MKRVLLRSAFFFLAAVGCLFVGHSSSGQEREPWRTDWLKFGEALAPYARDGVLERKGNVLDFNRTFSRTVEWRGTLRAFHANGVARFLELDMPPLLITLRDGSLVEVKELSIWCADEDGGCREWSPELVGREVVFRTELRNRTRGILPVVRVLNAGEEDLRVEIETYRAVLIKIEPN
jgi:hypothetical protein